MGLCGSTDVSAVAPAHPRTSRVCGVYVWCVRVAQRKVQLLLPTPFMLHLDPAQLRLFASQFELQRFRVRAGCAAALICGALFALCACMLTLPAADGQHDHTPGCAAGPCVRHWRRWVTVLPLRLKGKSKALLGIASEQALLPSSQPTPGTCQHVLRAREATTHSLCSLFPLRRALVLPGASHLAVPDAVAATPSP